MPILMIKTKKIENFFYRNINKQSKKKNYLYTNRFISFTVF